MEVICVFKTSLASQVLILGSLISRWHARLPHAFKDKFDLSSGSDASKVFERLEIAIGDFNKKRGSCLSHGPISSPGPNSPVQPQSDRTTCKPVFEDHELPIDTTRLCLFDDEHVIPAEQISECLR